MSWVIAVLLVLVIVLAITSLIPSYKKYQDQGKKLACDTALDTARRQLASNFMLNGFENGSAEDAKAFVTYVMNGWDDLCPAGGSVYVVPKANSPMDWEIICGLHCSDSRLCTRLNAYNVRDQLREALLKERNKGNPFPESLPYAYYSVVGHSDFGADSGMKEGQMWYFAYADEEHCANWSYHDEWTGDSYWNVTGTDYEYLSDMVIQ